MHQPDSGELLIGGVHTTLNGPAASRAAGVSIIYQEPTLFPDLTVAENIFMGRQPLGAARRIDRAAMRRQAEAAFARLGVELDPSRLARGLSVADQQIVEIAKAISFNARVIVMDEPTAALTPGRGGPALRRRPDAVLARPPCCSSRTGSRRSSRSASG